MAVPDEEFSSDDDWQPGPFVDASAITSVVEQIQAYDKKLKKQLKWKTGITLALATRHWQPHAVTESSESVLHVCLTGEIPNHIALRMVEAFNLGHNIFVTLRLEALYSPHILMTLAAVDARVLVLKKPFAKNLRPRHFMAALADLEVPTSASTRVLILNAVYSRIKFGTKQEKGMRFEALLAFLLSQVSDFKVVDRNQRTATQEIDMVVQISHYSQREWQLNVPYMLVEAKNRVAATPQEVVSTLINKIQTKGGPCKIALLISTSGFTSDADKEELRLSRTEYRIILIGPSELKTLLDAVKLDDTLDEIVRHGRMR